MKTNLFLSLCFIIAFSTCNVSFAQTNSYFQNNPVWGLKSDCQAGYPCVNHKTYNYYTNGDTIINSVSYKKIYEKGQGYYAWYSSPPSNCPSTGYYTYSNSSSSYFIRSINKEMYIRRPSDTNEQLLYDFDLSVGDSLPLSFNNFSPNVVVSAIDSVYTPYGYRKRFSLSGDTWSQYLIEGVGTDKGLVEPIQVPLECGYNLICYSLNDSTFYPNLGANCELANVIKEYANEINFSISPNPFNTATTIKLDQVYETTELIIYNLYGQKVKSINIGLTTEFLLEKENLTSGIYFISLKQKNNRSMLKKMVVTE